MVSFMFVHFTTTYPPPTHHQHPITFKRVNESEGARIARRGDPAELREWEGRVQADPPGVWPGWLRAAGRGGGGEVAALRVERVEAQGLQETRPSGSLGWRNHVGVISVSLVPDPTWR